MVRLVKILFGILYPLLFRSLEVTCTECRELQCMNGGNCYLEKSGATLIEFCLCPAEYEGDRCETKRECRLSCAHGACKFPYVPPSAITDLELNKDPYCFCDPGYSGVYCESPIDTCPDGKRSCYNGAKCREVFHPDGRAFLEPRYRCDCATAGDTKNPYAGLNCHIPAEKVCSLLTDKVVSFCVNGGTCKDITTREGSHFGCHCSDLFEGDHCEYERGTDPNNNNSDSSLYTKTANDYSARRNPSSPRGFSALVIFIVATGTFGSFIVILVTVRRISRKKRALQEAATAYKDDDVAFDADGNRMTNISIGEDPAEREGEII